MFKRSNWLEKYGLVPKIFLVCLLFVCIGGLNIFLGFAQVNSYSYQQKFSHNAKLDPWFQPPAYTGPEFDSWRERKEAAQKEIDSLYQLALVKGNAYSVADYFHDFDSLMELEDKYNIRLTSSTPFSPLDQFVLLRDKLSAWSRPTPDDKQVAYIQKIGEKIRQRNGELDYTSNTDISWSSLRPILSWLIDAYLKFMFFCTLIYIIRFEEHKKSIRRFQRHHHELGRFINDEEPFPGRLSFYDEILINPWRFIGRVLLWPKYFLHYPLYESPAQLWRFNRLKAEFLRYQPLGYQLTPREEAILLAQAGKPVKDFGKTIRTLFSYPVFIRRSVYLGYLSLVLGFLLQPVIVLAADYSKKIEAHCYGQDQTILAEQPSDTGQQIRAGTETPKQQPDESGNECLILTVAEMSIPLSRSEKIMDLILLKPKEIVADIVHVPIFRLLIAARCF